MNAIFNAVDKFFASLNNYIGLGDTFVIFISLFLLVAIVTFIATSHSYEAKLIKAIDMLNGYFVNNPKITEDNLILFNQIMRHNKVPKLLRKHWQQFMLYREHNASYYMSFENCVEIPLRNSKFKRDRLIMNMFAYILAGISLIFNTYFTVETADIAYALQKILLTPVIILLLNYIISIVLDLKESAIINDLHQNYQYFETNIDKATKSLPDYVDYEVLFDKAEIKKGIPVLYQFLQKRAEDEQRELELARLKNFEHEKFNFDEAGIASSLVLERAMTESENYIAQRKKYNEDIAQINSEIAQEDIKYRETTKEYNRQMQISKETFANFKKELEEASSTIQANYIKKQQQQELDRQRNLERDFDMQTDRHKKIISKYQQDLDAIDTAVAESKKALEDAMMAEFSTYSGKVYDEAKKVVEARQEEKFSKIKQDVKNLEEELYKKNKELEKYSQNPVDNTKEVVEDLQPETEKFEETLEQNREEENTQSIGQEEVTSQEEIVENNENTDSNPTDSEQPQESNWNFDYLDNSQTDNLSSFGEETNANEDNSSTMSYSDYLKNEGLESFKLDEPEEDNGNRIENAEEVEHEELPEEDSNSTVQEDESENIGENVEQESEDVEENYDWLDKLLDDADKEAEEQEESLDNSSTTEIAEENEQNQNETATSNAVETVEEPETNITSENVVKKKAGRPRKIVDETSVEPKRGRGRPKKEETVVVNESEPAKRRGRPRKTEEQQEVKDTTNVVKKKAGRPRKIVEETSVEPKRGRGRPKKEETVVVNATEPEKKRGRPKKATGSTVKLVSKKSVGRPRKEVQTTVTAKKKAGRPKKINLNNVDTEVDLDAYLKVIDNAIAKENAKMKRTQKALENQANIKNKSKK